MKELNYRKSIYTDIYILDKLILFFYGLYFILVPFYLWESGLPQIADFILVLSLILYVIKQQFVIPIDKYTRNYIVMILSLVTWIVIVNFSWAFILQTTKSFFRPILYYLYNSIVTILTLSLFKTYNKRLILTIINSIMVSVGIQFLIFIFSGGFLSSRTRLFFNNPNQLGFFILLTSGILMFLGTQKHIQLRTSKIIFFILISILLVFASLSNAAIISYVFLVFFFIFKDVHKDKTKRNMLIFTLILIIIIIYIYNITSLIQDNSLYQSMLSRLSQTTDKVNDSFLVRGYNRIIDYPQYWIFGSGEGAHDRFLGHGGEFHSTIGVIQLSYGVVGSFLFLLVLFYPLYRDKFKSWYILLAIIIYGFSHNGLRNSMFWILLALLIGQNHIKNEKITSI